MNRLTVNTDIKDQAADMILTRAVLSPQMAEKVKKRHIKDIPFYEDLSVFSHGFFKYYFGEDNVEDSLEEVNRDIKNFIDSGYYIRIGQDWGESLIIYGYEEGMVCVMGTARSENETEISLYKEKISELLKKSGFLEGKRRDEYLRLRTLKENSAFSDGKGGVAGFLKGLWHK
ncbi:MAG: hypothetical protein NC293_04830 [Roseburia sp.]|nr:hypothetical protein [Roseburia sp.]